MEFLYSFVLLTLLALFSQKTTSHIFTLFYKVIRNEKVALFLVCLLYLPGTFLHECSHLIAAMLLFLPVTHFTVIPQISHQGTGYGVKLGSVTFIKKDPIRGFLVGIAPIFGGILFFYFLPSLFGELGTSFMWKTFLSYLAFTVASTMISSKQDLVEAVYMIPIVIIFVLGIYILKFDILHAQLLLEFISQMNYHLSIATLINIGAYGITKVILSI